jgi:hypothetical protein
MHTLLVPIEIIGSSEAFRSSLAAWYIALERFLMLEDMLPVVSCQRPVSRVCI